jgi:hypothetical protein
LRACSWRRGPITIAGIRDAFSGHDRIEATLAAVRRGPAVVLTHSPDLAPRLPRGAPLVLAAHTHCGQVVLPWQGPLPGRSPREGGKRLYDQRYRCGVIHDPGRTVIVTAGVGSGSAPVRFGAPPDFWLITLWATQPLGMGGLVLGRKRSTPEKQRDHRPDADEDNENDEHTHRQPIGQISSTGRLESKHEVMTPQNPKIKFGLLMAKSACN